MARVHIRKARKDYPEHGIFKGDQYYFCQIKTGPRSSRILRQLQPFKQSQLTTSEFKSRQLELEERLSQLTVNDLREELEEVVDEIRCLGDEQQEKLDNMPEGLQQGSTGELLEGRASSCDEWASELEDIMYGMPEEPDISLDDVDEPQEPDQNEGEEVHEKYQEALEKWQELVDSWEEYRSEMESALEAAQGVCYNGE